MSVTISQTGPDNGLKPPLHAPIYLCFQQVKCSAHELRIDFLENPTSPGLVVQFHEQIFYQRIQHDSCL